MIFWCFDVVEYLEGGSIKNTYPKHGFGARLRSPHGGRPPGKRQVKLGALAGKNPKVSLTLLKRNKSRWTSFKKTCLMAIGGPTLFK